MVSINATTTNSFVLSSLRQTNAELSTTQNRIASGLKVASARDNASVWSTAQTIRTDLKAQDTVNGSIAVAKARSDVAVEALTTIQDILGNLATAAGAAVLHSTTGAGAINDAVQANVKNYQNQLRAVVDSAAFSGFNLLTGTTAVTATIGQDNGTPITLGYTPSAVVLDTAGTGGTLGSGSAAAFTTIYNTVFNTASTTTVALRDTFIATVNAAKATIASMTTEVGNYSNSLGSLQDFNNKVADIRNGALSALVDADMEKESAKVSALQVKQQLAFQALSIGNNSTQNILRLFQ
ncbi:flagellin [Aureimonas sp. AU12]|jgi:flagellin|uniref:flagellin N-terminal helical domain-containing protein n=1 Tax=Aureimonas sp. AU12 TaxID=1638161 RepID=UPI000705DE95|nr:flagellin [Aureimonas sp. AU12]BAT29717.1 flagellin C [Aureimonas sp. AU12]BAT29793.1 flagellin C [Aureimonas sp. AU12]